MTAATARRPTPTFSLRTSPRDKAAGGGKRHMQAKRKPAKNRWRADRLRQPLGSKIRVKKTGLINYLTPTLYTMKL
ncbi:hypothetical protein LINPERHAP1_LOCUS26804, partial [Linum perenne]